MNRHDAKAWEQVRRYLGETRARKARQLKERLDLERKQLQRQVAKLEALPENPGRAKEAARLRKRLSGLTPE